MSTPASPAQTPSSSEENLPEGWVLCESKTVPGRKYYFDRRSGSSLWTKPHSDVDKTQNTKSKKCKKGKQHLSPTKTSKHVQDDRHPQKRKSDSQDKESTVRKRTRQEDDVLSPTPSSSSGKTGTTKTFDDKRKNHEGPSQFDSASKDSQKNVSIDKGRLSTNKEQKPNIPQSKNHSPTPEDKANISACSVTNEGNDNADITWSPSQFFEANKLICSLQDQLAEEKGVKREKRKDTYAAIEEGITNQSVEYSSKNHPATPPHFRHASQIVSTIRTRLSENISVSERKPRFATPANDRLAALRSSLNQSARESLNNSHSIEPKQHLFENKNNAQVNKGAEYSQLPACQRQIPAEAMELDQPKEIKEQLNIVHEHSSKSLISNPVDNVVLVVDTNIFIHNLRFLQTVMDSSIEGYKSKPTLVVPWQVINELDRLKDDIGNKNLRAQARIATDYLYQVLPHSNRIKGQTIRDSTNHVYPCELPDDEVLNCCFQQIQRGNAVILVSNDKHLCTRALINSIRAVGVRELHEMLREDTDQAEECDLQELLKYYESCIYQLLTNILENEMRARYDNLWQHILFKAPPWTLLDVLQCLIKHWVAVFSEVFPRIEPLIQQVKTALTRIHNKGPRMTKQDVFSFKDLAHELASKCQIIPEYMELAKVAMEQLSNDQSRKRLTKESGPEENESLVVDAFETLWTAHSSFCANLADTLGVDHQLDSHGDAKESTDSLKQKLPAYSNRIQSIVYALKRTLTANENSGIEPLHSTLLECSAAIGANRNRIDHDTLRTFCLNNRNMIHEALVKFTQLNDLLGHCANALNK